jgi:hypothetical protein
MPTLNEAYHHFLNGLSVDLKIPVKFCKFRTF